MGVSHPFVWETWLTSQPFMDNHAAQHWTSSISNILLYAKHTPAGQRPQGGSGSRQCNEGSSQEGKGQESKGQARGDGREEQEERRGRPASEERQSNCQEAKEGQDAQGEKWNEEYDKKPENEETKQNKKVNLSKNILKNKSY